MRTSKNFGRLQAVESAKIEFEPKDSNLLDCKIDLSMRKKRTISNRLTAPTRMGTSA